MKDLVVKSNSLIEACYKLSLQESRLILNLAAQIDPDDSDFKYYTMSIKEIAEVTGLNPSSLYNSLKTVTASLLKKVICFPKGKGFYQTGWLNAAEYEPGNGTLTLQFNPKLKPYLLNLRECFTSYSLAIAIKFKSVFSFRIYELLKQYETIGKREIKISDLRKMLGVEDNLYPLYGNFKQKVIQVTQKELKEKSDIYFEFQEIKEGRSFVAIRFIIHTQQIPETKLASKHEEPEVDVFISELQEMLPAEYQKKATFKKMLIKYFDKEGREYVIRNIIYANDHSDRSNYRAYLSKALQSDYGLAYQEDQEAKKEAADRQRKTQEKVAKQQDFERLRVERERVNHLKAREMIIKLSDEEKAALEAEALQQMPEILKERYFKNKKDTIASLQIRIKTEIIFITKHPELFNDK